MTHWWEDDSWTGGKAMNFPDRRAGAPMRRITLTTDPVMERTKHGALRLTLVNRHPHERLRVYVAPGRC